MNPVTRKLLDEAKKDRETVEELDAELRNTRGYFDRTLESAAVELRDGTHVKKHIPDPVVSLDEELGVSAKKLASSQVKNQSNDRR